MKYPELSIEGRKVGKNHPPLVIAEIGINHGGSLEAAISLADLAIASGAEIVKHQTHIPECEMSFESRSVIPGNSHLSIFEVISQNSISLQEEELLAKHVRSKGAIFISTPFSREAADFLADLEVPAFKIGSGECNNYPFVEHVAKFGKPIILSTGMNSVESIRPSVEILRKYSVPFALMHCTNLYPTPEKLIRLQAINEIEEAFPDAVMGLSDHSLTNYPCLGSVALGASILERHFTDTKERVGPDINCSMTPKELKELICGSRVIHEAMGKGKHATLEETVTSNFAFSSVVATRRINIGELLTTENIWLKRPSGGDYGPVDYYNLLGKVVAEEIPQNTQVKKAQIED
jgi:N-acetylneuraminate synthase